MEQSCEVGVGVIRSIHRTGGYGFIRLKKNVNGEKLPDVYFHASECDNEFDKWKAGMIVRFEMGNDENGRGQACNVELVEEK